MTSMVAWVVDVSHNAILMDGSHPARLVLSKDLLMRTKAVHIYKDKIYTTEPLPDIVIALHSLSALGLIKHLGDQQYSYNYRPYLLCPYRYLVSDISPALAHAISHAIQLIRWRDDHRFCSRCGTPSFVHPDEYASTCPTCHHRNYPRIQPCVITAITRLCPDTAKPQILLALHHRHSNSGMHGLIAGFVEIGETLETAIIRETLEETGVMVGDIRYMTSQPWPYPTNLMLGFVASYQSGQIVADTSELAYARFFDLDNLPKIPQQGTIAHTLIQSVLTQYLSS